MTVPQDGIIAVPPPPQMHYGPRPNVGTLCVPVSSTLKLYNFRFIYLCNCPFVIVFSNICFLHHLYRRAAQLLQNFLYLVVYIIIFFFGLVLDKCIYFKIIDFTLLAAKLLEQNSNIVKFIISRLQ